jgi:hypothetical protein
MFAWTLKFSTLCNMFELICIWKRRRAVGPANASGSSRRPRRAAVGTGAGGAHEGKEAQAARAPGAVRWGVPAARAAGTLPSIGAGELHYVKTLNKSHNICNRPLTPVASTHICNDCCLAPVTYKRTRTTSGLASTTPVSNVDFW